MSASWRERARYRSDRIMSSGPGAQIAALALLTVLVIAIVFAVIVISHIGTGKLPKATLLYHELLEVIDSGTVGNFSGGSATFTTLSVLITIYGIFVVGSLIGILANALDQRIQSLRKGRSKVVESGHIVVLGWSEQIFSLLQELSVANENQRRTAIAVMATQDKVEMEDAIREKVRTGRTTRVVCRTGNPLDVADLGLLSLETCRAVIVLTTENELDPDTLILKTLMALMSAAGEEPPSYRVFAELHEEDNRDVAVLAGRGHVELVPRQSLTARIVAETSSQPGLSAVFTDLLDYEGDEIYIADVPEVSGLTFSDSLLRFEDSVPIGIAHAGGGIEVNPDMQTPIGPGDRIIAISEDDDTVVANGQPSVETDAIVEGAAHAPSPTKTLILGENPQLPVIAEELERRAAPGSLLVVASPEEGDATAELARTLTRQRLERRHVNPTNRHELESLDPVSFDRVVILTSHGIPAEQADARTLTTLLHVRDLQQRAGRDVPVVSEMQLPQNKALAEASTDFDFVVSTQLISLYISQVVMTPALSEVFRDLLTGDRGLIVMAPADAYVRLGVPVNFYTVTESARRRGDIALGYRRRAEGARAHEVTLNPAKSRPVTFGRDDQIVVLTARSEDPAPPAAALAGAEAP